MFSDPSADEPGLHLELLRLAIPRRTYTESHLRYVAEIFSALRENRDSIPHLRFRYKPQFLGHFLAKFEILNNDPGESLLALEPETEKFNVY